MAEWENLAVLEHGEAEGEAASTTSLALVEGEYDSIVADVDGTAWVPQMVDVAADHRSRTSSWFAVLTRRVARGADIGDLDSDAGEVGSSAGTSGEKTGHISETCPPVHSNNDHIPAGQTIRTVSGHNPLWERGMAWPEGASHRAGRDGVSRRLKGVGGPAAAPIDFSSLPTVEAMGTGRRTWVIGFDTEFTNEPDGTRTIDSYQFSTLDPEDTTQRVDVVILPLQGQRIFVEDALYLVVREAGLWAVSKNPEAMTDKGVARRHFWQDDDDYKKVMDALYSRFAIQLTLACHYGSADLTAFAQPTPRKNGSEKYADIMRHVTSASGGLVSLRPVRITRSDGRGRWWVPMSVTVRDTMGHAPPKSKGLDVLGESCGIPKIEVSEGRKKFMTGFRHDRLVEFLEYGVNDALIVVEYLARIWGDNVLPPVTLSGGGASAMRAGVMKYWSSHGLLTDSTASFRARFQGLYKAKDSEVEVDSAEGLSYYMVHEMVPVDGDATVMHAACAKAFHGGLNTCPQPGYYAFQTYDLDLQSAYPTAMASIIDIDYEAGCVHDVIKDRALSEDDFALGYVTPLVAFVSWNFPEEVEPTIPVVVDGSIIYPRTSQGCGAAQGDGMNGSYSGVHGAWAAGPEILLALRLGATVHCQMGYLGRVLTVDAESEADDDVEQIPSRSMRSAVQVMVKDRATAKRVYGKKSIQELVIKIATNSCYGKLAQDLDPQNAWQSFVQEMHDIGGSAVTSPYHAMMITSLVRAMLLAVMNDLRGRVYSVTTDGCIADVDGDVIEAMDFHGLSELFQDARTALVGDSTVWEVKHSQTDLVNVTTRGNSSMQEEGVLAKDGLKAPKA